MLVDYRDIKGMRATAEAIEKVVGKAGIDYLVHCLENG